MANERDEDQSSDNSDRDTRSQQDRQSENRDSDIEGSSGGNR